LIEGGVFIIQSDRPSPAKVWDDIPAPFQKIIADRTIRVFSIDGFKIAREEATDPELQLRMQGIAFQGAFFAASGVMQRAGLDETRLLAAIREQLEHKFGSKGARVVEDNVRVVRRGFDEVREVPPGPIDAARPRGGRERDTGELPLMAARLPRSQAPLSDVHRFWEQTGSFYARGMGHDCITDPFIGLGVMPAGTALFRDMTEIRFEHPEWLPERCTACGKCYTVCPDTAIPGLVSEPGAVLDTVVRRLHRHGHDLRHLPAALPDMERELRSRLERAGRNDPVADLLEQAIEETLRQSALEGGDRERLRTELDLFREELGGFRFALSRRYYTLPEQRESGSGGLFSVTVDPYTCKGCMECVEICEDDALRPVPQSDASVDTLRRHWDFWLDLPSTARRYTRIENLEDGVGTPETILLDKASYLAFTSGEGACLGCAEKTVLHLFIATVEALMQPRIEKHVARLDELIGKLERHVALPRMDAVLAKLEDLRWKYTEGTTGRGRSRMGMINATGCTSVWGSTYPFNPYPFPWANHLFQDSVSMAMGVFEGHMAKMAEGFKAIRIAELALAGRYAPAEHDAFFTHFDWHQFTDEEWELCPPVVAVGGDGAMYDIGFQNLSRALASGKPLKILVVDTQVYSNTGGQACTSGFLGQISDMAQFGKALHGKEEPRKEIGLLGMAHRTTYVMQSTIAYPRHMIEGFIRGLNARRPALFNLYVSCPPEHGIGNDRSARQAKLAVESRAYPLFRYDPDAGKTPAECFDLRGNPALDRDWPSYVVKYRDGDVEKKMSLPMTFADFAITEGRFRKHFRVAPPETWNEGMVPLAEFLEMGREQREGRFPYVWSVNERRELGRLLVDRTMVASCEDRRDFWTLLRALAGTGRMPASREAIAAEKHA
jgi:pyruvate-ferredoxin/flavodoxin oxidoreductase